MGCGTSSNAGSTVAPSANDGSGGDPKTPNKVAASGDQKFAPVTPVVPVKTAFAESGPSATVGNGSLPGLSDGRSDLTALMTDAVGATPTPKPPGGITASTTSIAVIAPLPRAPSLATRNGSSNSPAPASVTVEQYSTELSALLVSALGLTSPLPDASAAPAVGDVSGVRAVNAIIGYALSEYRLAVFTEDANNSAFVYRLRWAPPPVQLMPSGTPRATSITSPTRRTADGGIPGSVDPAPTSGGREVSFHSGSAGFIAVPAPIAISHSVERQFPAYTPPIADSDVQPYPLLATVALPEERVACACSNGTPTQVWDVAGVTRVVATVPPQDVLATEREKDSKQKAVAASAVVPGTTTPAPATAQATQRPAALVVTCVLCLPAQQRLVLGFVGGTIQFYAIGGGGAITLLEHMTFHVRSSARASGGAPLVAANSNGKIVLDEATIAAMAARDPATVRITAMVMLGGSIHNHSGYDGDIPAGSAIGGAGAGGSGSGSGSDRALTDSPGQSRSLIGGEYAAVRGARESAVDPRLVWIDSFDNLRAWNLRLKRLVYTARIPFLWHHSLVALKNHRLAIVVEESIKLYSTELRIAPATFKLVGHTKKIVSVCVMSDGCRLVSGGADGIICVWDTTKSYKPMQVLEGHTGTVMQVVPIDDDRLCSHSTDGTIKVWDLEQSSNQSCVLTIPCAAVRAITTVRS